MSTISQSGFVGTEAYTGSVVFDTITNAGNYVITADGATGGTALGASGGAGVICPPNSL